MDEASNSKVLSVDDLNDDCLIHIFTFLRVPDRLRIERVSKRWNSLAQLSWRRIKRLTLDDDFLLEEEFVNYDFYTVVKVEALQKVLRLCGPYLGSITFRQDRIHSKQTIISNIHTLCPKVKAVKIGYYTEYSTIETVFNNFTELRSVYASYLPSGEDLLAGLFDKNRKLRSLTLHDCKFSAECFSHMNHEAIEHLDLRSNVIHSIDLLVNAIKKLKNLQHLELRIGDKNFTTDNFNQILEAANSETITSLAIHMDYDKGDLSQVQCFHIKHFRNLEVLKIVGYGSEILKSPSCLDDQFFQSITLNCLKLTELEILAPNTITDLGFIYIKNLLQIESLKLYGLEISDKVLSDLKTLKHLFCCGSPLIKNDGLMKLIEISQNIRTIRLSDCQAINPEGLLDSIKKSSRHVLEVRSFLRIEGLKHLTKTYSFRKVNNELSIKIKTVCHFLCRQQRGKNACSICKEQEYISYIE